MPPPTWAAPASNIVNTTTFEHQQQQKQFQQALSLLNIDQRTAIALVYQTGLSNKAAAQAMNLQLKAFESLLGRAKSRLKQTLGEANER